MIHSSLTWKEHLCSLILCILYLYLLVLQPQVHLCLYLYPYPHLHLCIHSPGGIVTSLRTGVPLQRRLAVLEHDAGH